MDLNIYIILILTIFVDKIFIFTMPYGHLFISPIFTTKILITKKLQAPQFSNDGPLRYKVNMGYPVFHAYDMLECSSVDSGRKCLCKVHVSPEKNI